MTNKIDLNDKVKPAVEGAYDRGHPLTIAYVDEAGRPSMSIRGSTQVLDDGKIGVWARSRDTGLAKAIEANPNVSLLFFGGLADGSKLLLNIQGRAHADAARNDDVYPSMSETERNYDPEAKGIAVIIDVDVVSGMSASGRFRDSAID